MLTKKAVKAKYKELEQSDFYAQIDLTSRVNCYVCDNCLATTKTVDIDRGTTSFLIACPRCDEGQAKSSFYNDIAPDLPPTHEWYRPKPKHALKLPTIVQNHVMNGGLMIRRIDGVGA